MCDSDLECPGRSVCYKLSSGASCQCDNYYGYTGPECNEFGFGVYFWTVGLQISALISVVVLGKTIWSVVGILMSRRFGGCSGGDDEDDGGGYCSWRQWPCCYRYREERRGQVVQGERTRTSLSPQPRASRSHYMFLRRGNSNVESGAVSVSMPRASSSRKYRFWESPIVHTLIFVTLAGIFLIFQSIYQTMGIYISATSPRIYYDSAEGMMVKELNEYYAEYSHLGGALCALFTSCALAMLYVIWSTVLKYELEKARYLFGFNLKRLERIVKAMAILIFVPMLLTIALCYASVYRAVGNVLKRLSTLPVENTRELCVAMKNIQSLALQIVAVILVGTLSIILYSALTVGGWRRYSVTPVNAPMVFLIVIWIAMGLSQYLVINYTNRNIEKVHRRPEAQTGPNLLHPREEPRSTFVVNEKNSNDLAECGTPTLGLLNENTSDHEKADLTLATT